jgi:hypothetical protein
VCTRTSDITAVCFTAGKNTNLDLDPASQREEAHYFAAAVRHIQQVSMQFDAQGSSFKMMFLTLTKLGA